MEQDQKNQNEEEPLEELRKRLEAERREATRKRRERMRQEVYEEVGVNEESSNNNVNNIEVQQEIIQNIEDINAYDGDEIETNISNGAQQELLHNIARMNSPKNVNNKTKQNENNTSEDHHDDSERTETDEDENNNIMENNNNNNEDDDDDNNNNNSDEDLEYLKDGKVDGGKFLEKVGRENDENKRRKRAKEKHDAINECILYLILILIGIIIIFEYITRQSSKRYQILRERAAGGDL